MKFLYTESAKKELDSFKQQQVELLHEVIKQKKFVFGDEEIEVTASDVRDAGTQIRPVPSIRRKSSLTVELLPRLYITIGVISTAGGLAWPYLRELMAKDQPQFIFTVSGIMMAILGIVMQFYFRSRSQYLEYLDLDFIKAQEMRRVEFSMLQKEANKAEEPTAPSGRGSS